MNQTYWTSIKLLQLEIKTQADVNETSLKTLQHQLDQLNGGVPLDLSQIEYPVLSDLPGFEVLDSLIEASDPEIKALEQQREINKEQVELTRSMTLPKLEGGYHQQFILGQKYQGFHVGMTIPLWENTKQGKKLNGRVSCIRSTRSLNTGLNTITRTNSYMNNTFTGKTP